MTSAFGPSVLNSKSTVYVSVDVEASGPIPGEYSLLSIGACIVGQEDEKSSCFYIELKPLNENFVQEALDVTGFSMEHLKQNGTDPMLAIKQFDSWINTITKDGKIKPVFVAYPVTFDWSFVNYYFYKYLKFNPFGVSGVDIKSVWMGMTNQKWHKISKESILRALKLTDLEHTHNALDDAIEQSKIFKRILEYQDTLHKDRSQSRNSPSNHT
jgi:ribonuclease T